MSFRWFLRGSALAASVLASLDFIPHAALAGDCISSDSPNPIAQQYPNFATGTLNGTTLIVPISMTQAREIIPSEYAIVESAYRSLLPTFPEDMYPMVVTAVHDHDLQFASLGLKLQDFSVSHRWTHWTPPPPPDILTETQRAVLEFPFLDIFGDGYSSFRWAATMMITANNEMAITGSRGYGINVLPSQFDPPCDAYRATDAGGFVFEARTVNVTNPADSRHLTVTTRACSEAPPPYPLDFIRNVTNQPTFASVAACDNYVRLYNTSNTSPPHDPIPVRGVVATNLDPLKGDNVWRDVFGWNFATAFVEPPTPAKCETLRGFVDE